MRGFSDNITDPKYEEMLAQRFATGASSQGHNGTLILDKDEE